MAAGLLENFFREILDVLDVGIHILDANGNTVYYNSAMGRLERLDPANVVGKNLLEVFPSLNRETSTLLYVLNTGKTIIDKVQTYFNFKGQEITAINTTCPLKKGEEIVGALEIAKDITMLKELSEKVLFLQNSTKNKLERGKECHPFTRFTFDDIIGESREIKKAVSMAKKAAQTSSQVLIYGETGTGKELFAQSIHNASARRNRAFIAQNCAALPESLLEGILFGTVKGGFTGAIDRPGLFEQADGGTLLLDEINSMGINLQAKLLRVLQEGAVRRVGDTNIIPVNVRIIATTNEDPVESIKNGIIRKDLFYRLGVVYIKIPPLRERREDIPVLTKYFINRLNDKLGKKVLGVSHQVMKVFIDYEWPGNIRELENALEGSMNMIGDESYIDMEHLPFYISEQCNQKCDLYKDFKSEIREEVFSGDIPINDHGLNIGAMDITDSPLDRVIDGIEREIILKTLKAYSGNITKAAEKLRIKRQTLQYKMKKYGLTI
ncbi:MAG: arginine utilization regulatory protein [Thermoanaerobacteraceae bacterium]|nr:arginine utilization regulatory protein [Thermoanaerobacteraceae bacterium]